MNRSIALVFAHPDDESFGCAGTAARYARQGVPVDLITATRGERGVRLDVPEGVSTGEAREAELRQAAAVMGVRGVYFLDYIDADLEKVETEEVADAIVRVIRRVKPEIVITFGPDGVTGHADHIAISKAATRAFDKLGPRLRPRKLYYVAVPSSLVPAEEDWGMATRPDEEVTTVIDISGFFETKVRAIAAHRSQQDSRDFIDMLRQERSNSEWLISFRSKEFFFLARPPAPKGMKESDLFE